MLCSTVTNVLRNLGGPSWFAGSRLVTTCWWNGRRVFPIVVWAIIPGIVSGVAGCNVNSVLEQVVEARRLAADLHVQFTKSVDAANRAVMADTDDASASAAREAEQATQAVQRSAGALRPVLRDLGYTVEIGMLDEFDGRFATYRELDRTILELAIENTNLKAQRLAFGLAQQEADAFRDSLAAAAPATPAAEWRVRALAATALAAVREIQVLQAPHIAESSDEAMRSIETRMATEEAAARGALTTLRGLVRPASVPQVDAATATLDRFAAVNKQILVLSQRNSNVRSLALSLDQKRTLTSACESSLRVLQDALAKRGFSGTR